MSRPILRDHLEAMTSVRFDGTTVKLRPKAAEPDKAKPKAKKKGKKKKGTKEERAAIRQAKVDDAAAQAEFERINSHKWGSDNAPAAKPRMPDGVSETMCGGYNVAAGAPCAALWAELGRGPEPCQGHWGVWLCAGCYDYAQAVALPVVEKALELVNGGKARLPQPQPFFTVVALTQVHPWFAYYALLHDGPGVGVAIEGSPGVAYAMENPNDVLVEWVGLDFVDHPNLATDYEWPLHGADWSQAISIRERHRHGDYRRQQTA